MNELKLEKLKKWEEEGRLIFLKTQDGKTIEGVIKEINAEEIQLSSKIGHKTYETVSINKEDIKSLGECNCPYNFMLNLN